MAYFINDSSFVRVAPKQTGVTMIPVFPTEHLLAISVRLLLRRCGIILIPARPATAVERNFFRVIILFTIFLILSQKDKGLSFCAKNTTFYF
jgi:hypothetical protein